MLPRRFVAVPVPAVDQERVAPAQRMGDLLVGQPPLPALGVGEQQLRQAVPDYPVGAHRVEMAEAFQTDQRPFRWAGGRADRHGGERARPAVIVKHGHPPLSPCSFCFHCTAPAANCKSIFLFFYGRFSSGFPRRAMLH